MGNTYLFSQILRIPMADLNKRRTSRYKPKLAWFSLAALFMLTFLLYAGGFTTSIGAGMVFPDWPLSDGSLNPEGWMQNRAMLAEHSHRLLGALMGLIIIVLTVWIWIEEERTWARNLAFAAFALVLLQGLLGGMRVLFDSLQFAIVHGCLAQAFLCLVVSIAAAQSSWWFEDGHGLPSRPNQRLKRGGLILCGMIFIQLIIGAIMRHKGAGLAIPTLSPYPGRKSTAPTLGFWHHSTLCSSLTGPDYFCGLLYLGLPPHTERENRCSNPPSGRGGTGSSG